MLAVAMLIGVRPSTPDIATSGHTASTSATMAINHAQALLLIRIPSGPLKADATGVPFRIHAAVCIRLGIVGRVRL